MTPILVEIRARTLDEFIAEFGGLISHPGEEFTYVLEGELDFHSELYAPVRLRAGDSIYFDSEMGHAYLKATPERCRLLCSCTPRGPDDEVDAHVFINTAGIRHSVEPLQSGAPRHAGEKHE
jgi:mannose-6-phosphate isomerase-like protein (cupin superfamily)